MVRNRNKRLLHFLALGAMAIALTACNSGNDETASLTNGSGSSSGGTGTVPGTGTGVATLEWVAPSARVNGDPISMSELSGYRVYAGVSPTNLQMVAEINDPYDTDFQVTGLGPGTYYFYVTATDMGGLESPPSETRQKTI